MWIMRLVSISRVTLGGAKAFIVTSRLYPTRWLNLATEAEWLHWGNDFWRPNMKKHNELLKLSVNLNFGPCQISSVSQISLSLSNTKKHQINWPWLSPGDETTAAVISRGNFVYSTFSH